ncbi:Zinc finger, CCCH-type [Niveomyces insectorum RCEF 264]|uniref:Zinc finger, CCCH-type n=1 Tax=Niveomyces insectorum RCEF 264 TaxID=1081102 RepID=A0A167ZA96_9HYPO|nr:Zinc finger, CCCH-type [Niveomyces insectorum RCEF 264]
MEHRDGLPSPHDAPLSGPEPDLGELADRVSAAQQQLTVSASLFTRSEQDLRNARLDLADAVERRRGLQQQTTEDNAKMRLLVREIDNLKNRNPYVAVLIDGDGVLFQESFVRDGVEGGKRASSALYAAVAKHVAGTDPAAEDMDVVAKICANLTGLGGAMYQHGAVGSEDELRRFALGFSQSRGSFDFVDVGSGKERADSKIRESAKWHLKQVNCKLVVLGISHDAGYAPFLDEITHNEATRQRVVIAEGPPTVRELLATNVKVLHLNNSVLRADKLGDTHSFHTNHSAAAASTAKTTPTTTLTTRPAPHGGTAATNGGGSHGKANGGANASASNGTGGRPRAGLASSSSPTGSATGSVSPAVSYATTATVPAATVPAANSVQLPAHTRKLLNNKAAANAAALAKRKPAWAPGPRGLDPPVATPDPIVLEQIKKRKPGDKFCNSYVLRGECSKGDACGFTHTRKVSPKEKAALAFLARLNPCDAGQECDDPDCIYGHNCPTVVNGYCTQTYCKFYPDDHPPNTKFRATYEY